MEEYQQQSPEVRSNPYQSPMHNFGSSIIVLTNPENELHKLELTLRSLREDSEGNIKQVGEPLLNMEGVNTVMGIAQSVINQVTVFSNVRESQIAPLMEFLADTLARDLMLNRVTYNIKNETSRDIICFETLTACYMCLRRSVEGDDKKFWKGSVQEIRTSSDMQKRPGVLSSVMNWAKR